MTIAILLVAAYLIGSIPFGVIVGRLRGFDPRAVGSGNIGMTNVARAGGKSAAIITFVGDILKGAIPVVAARSMGFAPAVQAATAFAAFGGAIFSIFLIPSAIEHGEWPGGKGVSAALGTWLALNPLVVLFLLSIFGIVVAVTRRVSIGSISAAIALVPIAAILSHHRSFILLAIVMSALVIFRHQENIRRLIAGEEPPITSGSKGGAEG